MLTVAVSPFSEWLAERMHERRVNQSALATYLGTSASTVNAWLNRGAVPSRRLSLKLAEYFRVTPETVEMYVSAKLGDVIVRPGAATVRVGPGVLPELLEILEAMPEEEQRRFALPAVRLAEELLRAAQESGRDSA